jgi:hypothetical protein
MALSPERIKQFDAVTGFTTPTTTAGTAAKSRAAEIRAMSAVNEKIPGSNSLKSFATGMGASILSSAKGLGDLIGLKPTPFGEKLIRAMEETDQGTAKDIGKFVGDVVQLGAGASAIPSVAKSAPILSKVTNLGARALTTGGIVAAQEGEVGKGAAIAAGAELAIPVVGSLLKPTMRLVKSLASGLSGVSSKTIEAIIKEPGVSGNIVKQIDELGSSGVIQKNAETIINGVSKIRQEARKAYGTAIQELKTTDIDPLIFRRSIQPTLEQAGSVVKNGQRTFSNIEFDNPLMVKRASALIDELSTMNLDGFTLNKYLSKLESAKFKTTGSDAQRLAFNAFINDLSSSVRSALNQSTNKLSEINKAYSTDLQLTEAIEGIFGGVEFKNLNEIRKVSERLESLFAKKGISPEIIDDFLTRIGVNPSEFRATEAVRQITDINDRANALGLSITEVIRSLTSSVITPETIRDISILTGIAEQNLLPILQKLSPVARVTFIKQLVEGSD